MATTATAAGPRRCSWARRSGTVREQRGLSLRELARRVNVSPSFVSQIELGKANPSVGTLYSLVSVLGTTLDDLIGEQPATMRAVPSWSTRPSLDGAHARAPGRASTYPCSRRRAASGSRCRAWSGSG